MVVERRRDQSRADVEPAEQVPIDRRPGVLAPGDETVADRDLARPDARAAVDLALAPATLAGVAHQPARSMEAEAPRQDQPVGGEQRDGEWLAFHPFVVKAVEREADPAPRRARR